MALSGNKGEWAEIYIFLKLLEDGYLFTADENMEVIPDAFLRIYKIIREEIRGQNYEYSKDDNIVHILLNQQEVGPNVSVPTIHTHRHELWRLMNNTRGNIQSVSIESFLASIHIHKLKAPAFETSNYFGGTQDITLEVADNRNGIKRILGFSCKSDVSAPATLFNASKDNTNFIYKIIGGINDDLMDQFNNLYQTWGTQSRVPIADRIQLLKDNGCDLIFEKAANDNTTRNIVMSGGTEMPCIVGAMLKAYYFEGYGKSENSSISYALSFLNNTNPASYSFTNFDKIYLKKVSDLLYDMFVGMRFAKPWNGEASVNGGYIVLKNNGSIVAYHSCMTDEFKHFLVNRLSFESPSASRHKYMNIYKDNDEYYIKLNLQIRFQ